MSGIPKPEKEAIPRQLDPKVKKLQDDVLVLKNIYYQLTGQSNSAVEAIIANICGKLLEAYDEINVLHATITGLQKQIQKN